MRSWKRRGSMLCAIGLALSVGVAFCVTITSGATAMASQKAASGATATPAAAQKIVLGSGMATDANKQDPNTSFCEFPPGATAVNVDPGESHCVAGGPIHPFVQPSPPAAWAVPLAGTKWVGPDPAGTGSDLNHTTSPCPAGNKPKNLQACNFYVYNATFTLDNPCGARPSLVGKMLADNLAGVFLNGTFLAQGPTQAGFTYSGVNPPAANFTTPTAFSASTGFVTGLNEIDFVVWDATFPSTGLDYSATVTAPATKPCGTLKVCKVAGFGIKLGTPFTFKTTGAVTATTTVPAGPAPGGWCQIVGQGSGSVTVQEVIPAGDLVTDITSNDPGATTNIPAGTITTTIAPNKVTEVTYTDATRKAKTGFLEICKTAQPGTGVAPPPTFTFTVNGQTVTVPTNACTSPIQVAAGPVTVVETPAGGYSMAACSTIPAANLVSCDPASSTAVVNVAAGQVAAETILTVTNSNPTGG